MSSLCARATQSSVFKTAESFVTNPGNRCARMVQSWKFRDTVAKTFAEGVAPLAVEIAAISGASQNVVEGFEKAADIAKDGRMFMALVNIFDGAIGSIGANIIAIVRLVKSILGFGEDSSDDSIQIGRANSHNDWAVGPLEKTLVLGSHVGDLIGAGTYVAGFGVCRPVMFAKKCFGDLGQTANDIGKAFPTIMTVNHGATLFGSTCKGAFLLVARARASGAIQPQANVRQQEIRNEFLRKVKEVIATWLSSLVEFFQDMMRISGNALPLEAKIACTAVVSACGFYKLWARTA